MKKTLNELISVIPKPLGKVSSATSYTRNFVLAQKGCGRDFVTSCWSTGAKVEADPVCAAICFGTEPDAIDSGICFFSKEAGIAARYGRNYEQSLVVFMQVAENEVRFALYSPDDQLTLWAGTTDVRMGGIVAVLLSRLLDEYGIRKKGKTKLLKFMMEAKADEKQS